MAALTARRPAAPRPRTGMDLESLVTWAVKLQRADRVDTVLFDIEAEVAGRLHQGHSSDGIFTIERNGKIGCPIDGGGAVRGVALAVHPDAEAVADTIERLPWPYRRAILDQARLGGRPEWSDGRQVLRAAKAYDRPGKPRDKVLGRWEPYPKAIDIAHSYLAAGIRLVDRYGRSRIKAEEKGHRIRTLGDGTRQILVRWTEVEPFPSDATIAETNARYARWHAAMSALLKLLDGAPLRDRQLTGFAAPARPWDNA